MSIEFVCADPKCGAKVSLEVGPAGGEVPCPGCRKPMLPKQSEGNSPGRSDRDRGPGTVNSQEEVATIDARPVEPGLGRSPAQAEALEADSLESAATVDAIPVPAIAAPADMEDGVSTIDSQREVSTIDARPVPRAPEHRDAEEEAMTVDSQEEVATMDARPVADAEDRVPTIGSEAGVPTRDAAADPEEEAATIDSESKLITVDAVPATETGARVPTSDSEHDVSTVDAVPAADVEEAVSTIDSEEEAATIDARPVIPTGEPAAGARVASSPGREAHASPTAWGADTDETGPEAEALNALETLLDETSGSFRRYLQDTELSSEGEATVRLCHDLLLARPVAMKVMKQPVGRDRESLLRFLHAAQITAKLEHPNIPSLHEIGRDTKGRVYVTTELVKGRSLAKLLDEARAAGKSSTSGSAASLFRLLEVFLKACDAIGFAHARSVAHLGLRPDAVMVGDHGEVLVTEWDKARVVDLPGGTVASRAAAESESDDQEPASRTDLTAIDTAISTASLPASGDGPESQTEAPALDPEDAVRSDLCALGAILYEILCLEMPVAGVPSDELFAGIGEAEVVSPDQRAPSRNIPQELAQSAMKALGSGEGARHETADELAGDIRRFLEGRLLAGSRTGFLGRVLKPRSPSS